MLTIIAALLVNLFIETSESFTVVVPRDQIVAHVGSTVTLPCWISPPENAEALEIRWYRHDQFSNPVLFYQHGKIQDVQEESYRNRSSLTLRSDQSGGLKDGDVSLRLEKLRIQDDGSFYCYVSGEMEYDSSKVVLKVTDPPDSPDPPDSSDPWKALFFTLLICALLGLAGLILYKYRHKLTGKKTVKEVCDDETMESLTKEEKHKADFTRHEAASDASPSPNLGEEETATGLVPQDSGQAWPSADVPSSPLCGMAAATATHLQTAVVHSQPSEIVGDTNIEEPRKHAVQITIDRERSHPNLMVSNDCKKVKAAPEYKPTGKGFPHELCAFGAQRFTSGRHYWEVSLALEDSPPKHYWLIGVAKHGNFRLKHRSALTPSRGYWFLCSDGDNGFYTNSDLNSNPLITLSLTPRPEQLGVLLDYDDGLLSFYNVKERKHLLTMSTRFTGSVVPLFNPGVGDLCPLIILDCPEPVESAVESNVESRVESNVESNVESRVESNVESSEPLLSNSSDA